MPRTAISSTSLSRDGVASMAEVDGDAVNGNSVANTGKTVIVVRNNDASSHTVTFVTAGSVDGFAVADHAVSIGAGVTRHFSKFAPSTFGSSMGVDVDSTELKLVVYEP